jgi:hypothetical protein
VQVVWQLSDLPAASVTMSLTVKSLLDGGSSRGWYVCVGVAPLPWVPSPKSQA